VMSIDVVLLLIVVRFPGVRTSSCVGPVPAPFQPSLSNLFSDPP
jgi:hypothetical protein